jgi:ribA/ribD-fused uncharacterized protein
MPTNTSTSSPPSRPVFFWRPHEEGTGYLGQWYPSVFTVSGDTYATCEMWMMVQKARLFGDEDTAKQMLQTTDPKTHKDLDRLVRNFDNALWDESTWSALWGASLLQADLRARETRYCGAGQYV